MAPVHFYYCVSHGGVLYNVHECQHLQKKIALSLDELRLFCDYKALSPLVEAESVDGLVSQFTLAN